MQVCKSIQSKQRKVVVGLGKTGWSCVCALVERGHHVAVTDTRQAPPYLAQLKQAYPGLEVELGALDPKFFLHADEVIVSPGVDANQPVFDLVRQRHIPVVGDICLFAREVKRPVIAITGSNGKSTVTDLVRHLLQNSGIHCAAGGNLGTPALDLLRIQPEPEVYVLELSSFQLETTFSLAPRVATILNISEDHMDRYGSMASYISAKHRIFQGSHIQVFNRDSSLGRPFVRREGHYYTFGLSPMGPYDFGVMTYQQQSWLAYESRPLLPVSELKIAGRHNVLNALAALALVHGLGIEPDSVIEPLKTYGGLEHRCEWVARISDVDWYNDSKGTNVGATLAAIEGLGQSCRGKLILIAGGVGKGASFESLIEPVRRYVRSVVLLGEDGPALEKVLREAAPCYLTESLDQAVGKALKEAQPGDIVLFSPACASFDMFKNYEDRGVQFKQRVLLAGQT